MTGKCNCGRNIRYTFMKNGEQIGSCNKYGICPTYDQLRAELDDYRTKYNELYHKLRNFKKALEELVEIE